jgi:hypothetical protein
MDWRLRFTPGPLRRWDMPMAPKTCSADPKKSAISSQGIREHISVMVALKFPYILNKRMTFIKNNSETSAIGYVFVSCDR